LLAESQHQTLVVVFEDLHWVDTQSRMLLDHLADRISSSRILLLITYRPEFDSGWAAKANFSQITLDLLSNQGAEEMLSSLLPATEELKELRKLIFAKTCGHPFFMEETVHALFEDGTLLNDELVRLTKPLVELQLPTTVHGMIAERIDRLAIPDKDFLQMLSVIGDRLPLDLIIDICGEDGEHAQEALAMLQDHGYIQAIPAQESLTYRFNHVLLQEVAYRSMLAGRRQALHELVATGMEHLYAERLTDYVGQLAYHYRQTNNIEKAIDYLGRAGEVAIQRSAHQEAEECLRQALQKMAEYPASPDSLLQESRLWLALGVCLLTSKGYAAQDVGLAFEKASKLSERSGNTQQLVSAVRGHSLFCIVRADYENSFRLGKILQAMDRGDSDYAAEYMVIFGYSELYTGKLRLGRQSFQQVLAPSQNTSSIDIIQYSGHSRAMASSYLALNTWYLGHPDQALEHGHSALAFARQLSIPITLCQAQGMLGILYATMRFQSLAEESFDKTCAYADEQGLPYWSILGYLLKACLVTKRTGSRDGIQQFEQYLQAYIDSGARIGLPWFYTLLAELHLKFEQIQEGLHAIDEALRWTSLTGERIHEAETLRIKGELLLRFCTCADSCISSAIDHFQQSLTVARQQESKSIELRAAMSLANVLVRHGRSQEAREIIMPVHAWFTEGFETPDLKDACTLVANLKMT
jgi:predicted ATPase